VNYTLVVRNAGPAIADAAIVALEMPAGMQLLGASTAYTASGQTLYFSVGSIDVGSQFGIQVAARITATGPATLTSSGKASSASYDPKDKDNASATIVKIRK
jgi:hypothetical protein